MSGKDNTVAGAYVRALERGESYPPSKRDRKSEGRAKRYVLGVESRGGTPSSRKGKRAKSAR